MRKTHYIRQKFLVEDESASGSGLAKIILQDFDDSQIQTYGTELNLFDLSSRLERKIKISEFDKMIDTEKEFDDFAQELEAGSVLFIEDDRPKIENPIYKVFSRSLFERLAAKLLQRKIECRIYCKGCYGNVSTVFPDSNQSDKHRKR